MTDQKIAFIRARLAEDTERAEQWPDILPPTEDGKPWRDIDGHIIYEPRPRLLADVTAKRNILDLCEAAVHARSDAHTDGAAQLAEWIIDELPTPYTSHPDYRKEWRR